MRRGVTLAEVLVGIAVLALGLLPLAGVMRGSRGMLSDSRDMLLLESATLSALERGRARVRAGLHSDLEVGEERDEDLGSGSHSCVLRVRRAEAHGLFELEAQAARGARFVVMQVVEADPVVSLAADPGPIPVRPEGSAW